MENKNIEETNDNQEEEETSTEENSEETSDEEQETSETKPEGEDKVATQAEINKLYARAKLAEEKAKKATAELAKSSSNKPGSLTLQAIKVGKKLEKFSEDEIDSVAKIIKSDDPQAILDALNNDFIKQGIELERQKVANKKKIPGSSSGGSSTSSDKSPQEIADLLSSGKWTREDHRKHWEKMKTAESQGL